MLNLKDFCQTVIQNSEESNIVLGQSLVSELLNVLPNETDQQKNMSKWIILSVCLRVINTDSIIKDKEVAFVNAILSTSLSKEFIQENVGKITNNSDLIFESISEYKEDIKEKFVRLMALFACCDGEISNEEYELINSFVTSSGS